MTGPRIAIEETGLDLIDPATHPARDAAAFRRIVAARAALERDETELRDAVAAARAAGDSWTVIGAALGVSRQAAQQRFRDI
ncbi:hypothetical protein [Janibacter massiliensis]|uniref:hypothetical protein n=1 Tax=Janibacter massiliensis TaxID=2058291 RepID=UPI000D104F56|nr:hypothetical protein [Janibacter massiliensis]